MASCPSLFRLEYLDGLGCCAVLDHDVAAGTVLLEEEPLLATVAPELDASLAQEALSIRADERSCRGGLLEVKDPWHGSQLWSGAALSLLAVQRLLGLLASYIASPNGTRRAVLELDDTVEDGAAASLVRELALLACARGLHFGLRPPEVRCVLRIAWTNALPLWSRGAALFSTAARCAHGCRPHRMVGLAKSSPCATCRRARASKSPTCRGAMCCCHIISAGATCALHVVSSAVAACAMPRQPGLVLPQSDQRRQVTRQEPSSRHRPRRWGLPQWLQLRLAIGPARPLHLLCRRRPFTCAAA